MRSKFSKTLPVLIPVLFAVVLFSAGCGQKSDIVAKVGSMSITADDFKQTMIQKYRSEDFASKRELKDRITVLQTLVDNKLKVQDAYKLGLDEDSAVVAKAAETQKQAAIQELYKVEILDKVIPPQIVRDNYDKLADEIKARHILLKLQVGMEETAKDSIRKRAEIYHQMVLAGVDFDSLAKAVSEDVTTAQRGGDLGYFTWGRMVDEFQEAAFGLGKGEVSNLVESSYGFHIIKLEDRRKNANRLSFEEEEPNILMNLRRTYQQELNESATAYLEKLKEEGGLKFEYANIQKILDKVSDPSVPRNQDYFSNFNEEERDWVVAYLGGDTITVRTLAKETAKTGPPNWRDQQSITQAVERLYLPDMLAQKAKTLGLYKSKTVADAYKTNLENEMIRRVEEIQVDKKIDLSDEALHTYYDTHSTDFLTDSTVEVQEIYILVNEDEGKNEAFAKSIAKKAKSGQNFATLVKKHSDRKSAMGRDGKIGPITSRQYGEMGKAAFSMKIGEISDPIPMGRRGYSIIKLLDKTPASLKSFDEARPQVERMLRTEKSQEIKEAWMTSLEQSYPVTMYEDKLMSILPQPDMAADTSNAKPVNPHVQEVPVTEKDEGK